MSGNCLNPKQIECAGGKCIFYDEGVNLEKAKSVAKKGDVVIVYVNAEANEGNDRRDLNLDDNANELIAAAASVNKNVIVVMTCPGHIATPWRD